MIDCMKEVGTPLDKASMLAANLTEADFRGHFSHGLNRLAYYVADIKQGCCDPNADPTILKEGPSTAWVDGNNGLGVVVGTYRLKAFFNLSWSKWSRLSKWHLQIIRDQSH